MAQDLVLVAGTYFPKEDRAGYPSFRRLMESITDAFLLICGGRLLASGTAEEVQQLLADVPNEIEIRTNHPHRLAGLLIEHEVTDELRIDDAGIRQHAPAQVEAGPVRAQGRRPQGRNDVQPRSISQSS